MTTLEQLAAVPVPADAYGPARAVVSATGAAGYRLAWALVGGRRRDPFGPTFDRPREACRLSRELNARGDR
jgi:hypothetical protein